MRFGRQSATSRVLNRRKPSPPPSRRGRGMSQLEENDSASIREMAALILPLTEASDDR